jgi:phospholipase/lecithinase/hemolysin
MPQTSSLPTFGALYAFGDSLADAGNLSITTTPTGSTEPVSPPYFQQKYGLVSGNIFSNGPTWVQNLSLALGLGTLSPSLTGGTDFAFGGAETGTTPQSTNSTALQAISLPAQISQFQTTVPKPSVGALYTVSIGSDDLLDILAGPSLTAQQQTADVNAAVANEISSIKQLVTDGAKNLLILTVPDLGKTPDVTTGFVNGSNTPSAALNAEATQLASSYNAALAGQLATIASAGASTGVVVHVVDTFQLLNSAIANPASFGLVNATSPVWSGNFTSAGSGSLAVTGTAAQNQFLFFDRLHPTETGHQALADAAEQQLSGLPVLTVQDITKGQPVVASGQPYTGPVSGLQQQYINVSTDKLNITATTPNWFIHGGSGDDAIAVSGGTNVLDGATGSNFLTGGGGTDTFFVDDRGPAADIWSTVVNFHAGDAVTLFGVTPSTSALSFLDGAGAAGFTGLTLTAATAGKPVAIATLAGYTQADLSNGRLSMTSGTDAASGSVFTIIQAHA